MSSMLEQAILDAKELKEAAIKNAQQALIEKYSDEFEGEVEKLLEQVAPADPAGVAAPIPAATGVVATPVAPGAAPVDPEKAKADSDAKSDIFNKLDYAFKDGEVIEDKVYPTGVIEIDLDSLSEFGFKKNQVSIEQLALQELKALSRKSKLNEQLEEEMTDDEDYEEDSDTFPYESEDEDEYDSDDDEDSELEDELEDDEDMEDDLEDEEELDDESDADELDDLQSYNDEGSFEDESDIDDEDDLEIDIEDEEFSDDEDLEGEDLYGTEEDVGFHVDYDVDEDESEEDYNPDADVEDYEEEESEEESEEDDEEELYEARDLSAREKGKLEDIIDRLDKASEIVQKGRAKNLIDSSAVELKRLLDALKDSESKEDLKEAIKLDYKRSGPRSPWNGMFREEGEHDVALANLQAEIAELEQETEELKASNDKLRSGLKESVELIESLNDKVAKYEQKLLESRILNYKLLYTNKVLSDSSLNGQQKNKIAESINGAKTAEEVKLLYETLKSTMRDGTSSSVSPKSLSEAVERRSSSLLLKGSRSEPKKHDDYAERMKKLAGLA